MKILSDRLRLQVIARQLGLDPGVIPELRPESVKHGLYEIVCNICESVLPHAAHMGGFHEAELRAKFLGSRVVFESHINAKMQQRTSDGAFQVTVYAPLMAFIWQCSKLWSTRIGVMETTSNPVENPTMSWPETVDRIRQILDAFWSGELSKDVCPITYLSPSQIKFAGDLMSLAERFVVAHEFGHALLQLESLGTANRFGDLLEWARGWARFYAADIMETLGCSAKSYDVTKWRLHDFEIHWGEEFAADILGAKIALECDQLSQPNIVGLWAIESLLIMIHMIELHHRTARGFDLPIGTHPYGRLRLSVIRSALIVQDAGVEGWNVGQFFEDLSDQILDCIRA